LHPPSENVPIARWPKIPNLVFAETVPLSVPQLTESWWNDSTVLGSTVDRARRAQRGVPLPREPLWPRQVQIHVQVASADADALHHPPAPALPVPAAGLFEVTEGLRVAMRGLTSLARRVEQANPAQAEAEGAAKPAQIVARTGKHKAVASAAHGRRAVAGKRVHREHATAPAGRNIGKRAIPDKKNAKRNGRQREARL
jgi:hypothetical protein